MKWINKGMIYSHSHEPNWKNNSGLQPTAFMLNIETIRIYCGMRDDQGVSRVGFVDVSSINPSIIKSVSDNPVLDIGLPGRFDDNGVVPTCVYQLEDRLLLYYAGYNIGNNVRMTIFTGLAVSFDNGETFQRVSETPILDRIDGESLFRVIHSIIEYNNEYYIYYGAGNSFLEGKDKTLPSYNIRLIKTKNLFNFPNNMGKIILDTINDEYRVARPNVFQKCGVFKMYFCYGSEEVTYKLGYAESYDLLEWVRFEVDFLPDSSIDGWDSEMMAYPFYFEFNGKEYLFYNGNDYGKAGFGYAILEE